MADNFVELNGKKYDALTGQILPGAASAPITYTKEIGAPARSSKIMDSVKPRPTRQSAQAQPKHHKTQKSKTLMRHAVKKPAAPVAIQANSHAAPAVRHHGTARMDVNPARASRAQNTHKSHLVRRFGEGSPSVKLVSAPLPVQPAPNPSEPPLVPHGQGTLESAHPSHSFQHTIDRANSHTQPHAKKTSRRHRVAHKLRISSKVVNVSAISLAVLLLGGFFAYQNAPNLSMRIAADRAGVQGGLPSYSPAGFGLAGPIKYTAGHITFGYKSHSDGRSFQVSQKNSDWNSASLLENFVATNNRSYQTYQDNGKTIYIYDGDNATWMDGGVWYQIEGKSALNSDQLLRLAASM